MNRPVNAAIKRVHNRVFRDGGRGGEGNQGIKARADKRPRLPEAIHLIIGIGELSNVVFTICLRRARLYSNNNSI